MSTRRVISLRKGRTHVLRPAGGHSPEVFQARCGHLLPLGVAQHECLPGRLLCVTCLWRDLVPVPASPARVRLAAG
ncbi:MAG: hypothetical protein ACRDRA_17565 [Pseudonocardiaceae bacterium]